MRIHRENAYVLTNLRTNEPLTNNAVALACMIVSKYEKYHAIAVKDGSEYVIEFQGPRPESNHELLEFLDYYGLGLKPAVSRYPRLGYTFKDWSNTQSDV